MPEQQGNSMHPDQNLRKLHYRAWHRGTREADAMVGGFFDAHSQDWTDVQLAWFEQLIEEQDVDIMAWAMGIEQPPAKFSGPMMDQMRRLDFITLPHGLEAGSND
jgi:antitoxin CptB